MKFEKSEVLLVVHEKSLKETQTPNYVFALVLKKDVLR